MMPAGLPRWLTKGGIATSIQLAILQLAMFAGLSAYAVPAVAANAIDGADVSQLIIARLNDEGLDGTPAIAADRTFPACDGAPRIEPMFGGWNTVAVRCEGKTSWRFAIRTNLSKRPTPVPIRDFRPGRPAAGPIDQAVITSPRSRAVVDEIEVVALARSVSRNDMIGVDDLTMVTVSVRNGMGAFFNPDDVAGRRMKTSLSANQPLMARHLYPDYLVEEGNEVLISSSAGGISVEMVGYALENGQIGEWIGVENASSGKTIRAKITGEKSYRHR